MVLVMKEEIHRSTWATLGDLRPTLVRQKGYYKLTFVVEIPRYLKEYLCRT